MRHVDPPWPGPGGKRRQRRFILPLLAPHRSLPYCEPFVGGGAIALTQCDDGREVGLNDRDCGAASWWTMARYHAAELCRRVRGAVPNREQFTDFRKLLRGHVEPDGPPERALEFAHAYYCVRWWSHSSSGMGFAVGWSKKRWRPEARCRNIMEIHRLLARVRLREGHCTCRDYSACLGWEALRYFDPPWYMTVGTGRMFYRHLPNNHAALARKLRQLPWPWVLSYDVNEVIRHHYRWAEVREIAVNGRGGMGRRKGQRYRPALELLITPKETPCRSIG